MLKFIVIYFTSLFLIASDNKENVDFNIDYPIEYMADIAEKTYILYETPISQDLSQYNFNRIIANGKVNDPNIKFEIWVPQTEKDGNITYSLIAGKSKIFPNGRFWVFFEIPDKINKFKMVVINNGVKKEKFSIEIYEIQTINFSKKKDETQLDVSTTSFSIGDSLPFKLIRRSDWHANPPKESYIKHTPQRITIHHTAGNYPQTYEDALSEIQFIQDYHQNVKGWIDIGYHFLIDPLGDIFEGRPILAVGAHVANKNTDNIGISIMGYYHPPKNNEVSSATISSIITLARYLKDTYSISSSSFAAHRDLAATDCPGDILYSYMDEFKKAIFEENVSSISVNLDVSLEEDKRSKLLNVFDY